MIQIIFVPIYSQRIVLSAPSIAQTINKEQKEPSLSSFLIWKKSKNIIRRTRQNITQTLQRINRDPPIMFQIVNRPRIKAILRNQGIGRDISFLHYFPKWFITYHIFTSQPYYGLYYTGLNILKNVSISRYGTSPLPWKYHQTFIRRIYEIWIFANRKNRINRLFPKTTSFFLCSKHKNIVLGTRQNIAQAF